MAILTMVEAARLTGVSRSQLYRYIRSGKLSRTPAGLLDTAELLRAGLLLHVPSVPSSVSSPVSPAVPMAHHATNPPVPPETPPVSRVPSADRAILERLIEVLQLELAAARMRETLMAQRMHERETQLTQAAHERETQLLHLLAQMQQQNQRLLDLPRQAPQEAPHAPQIPRRVQQSHPAPQNAPTGLPGASTTAPRGATRRRIVALLQDHPEGLTTAEMR